LADNTIAKIVTPTRTLFFRRLEEAFTYSDVMIEEHSVYARDALSGNYVLVGTRWLSSNTGPLEDADEVSAAANQQDARV